MIGAIIAKLFIFLVVGVFVGVSLVAWLNRRLENDCDRAYASDFDPRKMLLTAAQHGPAK